LLAASAIIVVASLAGGGAWLYLTHGGTAEHAGGVPRVTMSLNSFHSAEPESTGEKAIDAASPVSDNDTTANGAGGGKAAKSTQVAAAGLYPHPDPSLIEKSDLGPLPIIGKDGRMPWRVYARPFSSLDKRPRAAVVVTMLGVSEHATKSAVETLPGEITLSFAPFAKNLSAWIDKARTAGHEVLIDLPMEPLDYPQNDPGPHTLLASVPIDQNLRQLSWVLSRATGYVGVSVYMGTGLAGKQRILNPIFSELKARGLMLLDTRENPLGEIGAAAKSLNLAVAVADLFVDRELSAKNIDAQLADLEKRARANGSAIAIARPYPVTLKRLTAWYAGLKSKGIVLAPVSALPMGQNKR